MDQPGTRIEIALDPQSREGTAGPWMLVLKAAAFIALAVLLSESLWRVLGYQPAGSDTIRFAELHNAAMNDPAAVALVGSSRMRCGLNPGVLNRRVPGRRFLQLGILGNSGIPVLQDLAADASFRGSVICEIHATHWLLGSYPFSGRPEPLLYAHPRASGAFVEMFLGEHTRRRFAFYNYNMITELPRIVQHRPIPPPERADRFLPYREISAAVDAAQLKVWLDATARSGAQIAASRPGNIPEMVPVWVRQIRARGGDVVFVHMPVDGELRALEERVYPQTPALIAGLRSQGMQVVDYAEMPARFACPDGSHLSAEDADRFSLLLAGELEARHFFEGR